MGVHVSFVQSTNMDNWSVANLRNMRVGGNKSAREFFSQNGGSRYLSPSSSAPEKYQSRPAKQYLDELRRRCSIDAQKYPDENVLDTSNLTAASDASSSTSSLNDNDKDSFFSNFDKPIRPAQSRSALSPSPSPSSGLSPSASQTSLSRASPAPTQPRVVRKTPMNKPKSSIVGGPSGSAGKKRVAAKKIDVDIDFDAAEKEAKEEEARIAKLGYNPNATSSFGSVVNNQDEELLPASISASIATKTTVKEIGSTAGRNGAQDAPSVEQTTQKFVRMGFGQISAPSPPPAASATAKPKAMTFGSTNTSSEPSFATSKFGNQKSISSDEYFGRNNYDPQAQAEAQTRLQDFRGATAISSNSYFGRDEEEEDALRQASQGEFGSMERVAQDLADRVRNITGEDMNALKDAMEQGASKLTDLMRDYLR